jgi:glycosyltransferase involved in cell wall biosynthesis
MLRTRILVVDHAIPTPDQDSGSASTFAYLRILAGFGYSLTFATPGMADAGAYTQALNDLGIATPTRPGWPSLQDLVEGVGPRTDVFLLYRGVIAATVFDIARRVAPSARIVFHPVDLHFLRMERQSVVTGDSALAEAAQAIRVVELDLVSRADATIVVSSHESALLRRLVPHARIHQIPILREVPPQPTGLFGWRRLCRQLPGDRRGAAAPHIAVARPGFACRRNIVFIGGFSHAPNVDAVHWFVAEVWPRLRQRGFSDRLIIAGSNVPPSIAGLTSATIEVRGHVADLAPLFDRCRLSVAPLRFGGGIKGKIVTSLSYGVPVVATSIGVEGMGLRNGEDIMVADDPEGMAEQIIRLYGDVGLWRRVSANAFEAFHNNFSEAAGASKVRTVVEG